MWLPLTFNDSSFEFQWFSLFTIWLPYEFHWFFWNTTESANAMLDFSCSSAGRCLTYRVCLWVFWNMHWKVWKYAHGKDRHWWGWQLLLNRTYLFLHELHWLSLTLIDFRWPFLLFFIWLLLVFIDWNSLIFIVPHMTFVGFRYLRQVQTNLKSPDICTWKR